MFLDNDMVLGNLFIKVIEKEMNEITFEKIYDFVYYASIKLNEKENTIILVSKEGIMNFAELYKDFIQIDEEEKKIIITSKEETLICFRNRYEDNGKDFAESFDFALEQIAA
ncbi:MAG: hypothetical protein NC313_04700 [Butyrivibrio sp.]|nr:hypothetical protein [Butyrivibrio sp.]